VTTIRNSTFVPSNIAVIGFGQPVAIDSIAIRSAGGERLPGRAFSRWDSYVLLLLDRPVDGRGRRGRASAGAANHAAGGDARRTIEVELTTGGGAAPDPTFTHFIDTSRTPGVVPPSHPDQVLTGTSDLGIAESDDDDLAGLLFSEFRLSERNRQQALISDLSIGMAPTPRLVHAAALWLHLDRNTSPPLMGLHRGLIDFPWPLSREELYFRQHAIVQLQRFLGQRVEARRWAGAMETPLQLPPLRGDVAAQLAVVESTLHAILRPWPRWRGDPDPDEGNDAFLDAAYRAFGSGALQLVEHPVNPGDTAFSRSAGRRRDAPMSLGNPDSALIVLLPEVALAAIEFDLRASWWRRQLPGLLAMVDDFRHAYGPADGGPAGLGAYMVPSTRRCRPAPEQPSEIPIGTTEELAQRFGATLAAMFNERFSTETLHRRGH